MKKIFFILPSLHGGGAEKITINLAREISKQGYFVEIILFEKKGIYLEEIEKEIKIFSLNAKKIRSSIIPLFIYLKKNKPSVIISVMTNANIIALFLQFFLKIKVIVTEHNLFSQEKESLGFYKKKIYFFLAQILYPRAISIVAVSNGIANDLINNVKINKKKVITIYNPIDIDNIKKNINEKIVHKWIGNDNFIVILGIGRLSSQKNFSLLIHSFSQFKKKKPNAKLVILGEGEERKELEKLIFKLKLTNDIDMPGFIKNPYPYLSKSNIFVLSSNYEGLPTVLIESLICRTQIISTECGSGPREILKSGKYGAIVPINNINCLSLAMEKILKTPYSFKGVEKELLNFNITDNTKKYLKIINSHHDSNNNITNI